MRQCRRGSFSIFNYLLQFIPTKVTLDIEAPTPSNIEFCSIGTQENLALVLSVRCWRNGLKEVFIFLERDNERLALVIQNETDK